MSKIALIETILVDHDYCFSSRPVIDLKIIFRCTFHDSEMNLCDELSRLETVTRRNLEALERYLNYANGLVSNLPKTHVEDVRASRRPHPLVEKVVIATLVLLE